MHACLHIQWYLSLCPLVHYLLICPKRFTSGFVVQHLPSLFLVFAVAGSFVLGTALSTVPFVCFGTYFAWVYLRFLQYKPELSAR